MNTRVLTHAHTHSHMREREGGRERERERERAHVACLRTCTHMRAHTHTYTNMHSCNWPLFCNDLCEDVCRPSSNFTGSWVLSETVLLTVFYLNLFFIYATQLVMFSVMD